MKQEMGFSDDQVAQLSKLRSDARKLAVRRMADIQIARMELRELLDATGVDERAIGAKVKELGDLRTSALKAQVDRRLAMRRILTPEQQEKLKQIIRHRLEAPRPRRSGPGGGGPGRDDESGWDDEPGSFDGVL
jgi:Spy/CpxP family protein refolding chaperone